MTPTEIHSLGARMAEPNHSSKNALNKASILKGADASTIGELDNVAEMQLYQAGDTVYTTGETPIHVYFVADGTIALYSGDTETRLDDRGPGAVLGELAAIDGRPYPGSTADWGSAGGS
jgi:CRP/FNR family transcriptional regulator, cyclic AMP receptor protein